MKISSKTIYQGLAVVFVSAGCGALPNAPEPEDTFGDAVRGVMNSQIYDYDAAINPDPEAVLGSDPNRLDNVLNTYRDHISKPEDLRQPIQISVGN